MKENDGNYCIRCLTKFFQNKKENKNIYNCHIYIVMLAQYKGKINDS